MNPFAQVGAESLAQAPRIVSDATAQAKEEMLAEGENLFRASSAFQEQVQFAQKKKNGALLQKLQVFGMKLLDALFDFAKRAIVLAVYKLIIELCAMVINQVMESITKAGKVRMDISTPGVHYTGSGAAPVPPGVQGSTPAYSGNPFASAYGGSPW